MPNEKYAKSVVSQVLSGRHKRQFWEGSFSYIVWFLNTFMPAKIFVSGLSICAKLSLNSYKRITSSGATLACGSSERPTPKSSL